MDLQRPEALAEGNLVLWLYVLLAKHQHMVLQMGLVEGSEVLGLQRLRQIQACDLCAQGAWQRSDIKVLGHAFVFLFGGMAIAARTGIMKRARLRNKERFLACLCVFRISNALYLHYLYMCTTKPSEPTTKRINGCGVLWALTVETRACTSNKAIGIF
jgi:hypothetical protein